MTSDITGEQGRGRVTKVFGYQNKEFGLYLKGNMEQRFLRKEICYQMYIFPCVSLLLTAIITLKL